MLTRAIDSAYSKATKDIKRMFAVLDAGSSKTEIFLYEMKTDIHGKFQMHKQITEVPCLEENKDREILKGMKICNIDKKGEFHAILKAEPGLACMSDKMKNDAQCKDLTRC